MEKENKFPLRVARYNLLVALPEVEEKTASGLYKPQDTAHIDTRWSVEVQIMAIGPDAFKDKERFPTDPGLKVGDWVVINGMSGSTGFKLPGYGNREFRFIADDSPLAYLDGPGVMERM